MLTFVQTRTFAIIVTLSWIGLVFYLGSVKSLPSVPSSSIGSTASLGHYAIHAVLATLIYLIVVADEQTLRLRIHAIVIAFVAALSVGVTLEGVQVFLSYRAAEVSDVLFDAAGALTGALAVFTADQFKIHRALLIGASTGVVLIGISYVIVDATTS